MTSSQQTLREKIEALDFSTGEPLEMSNQGEVRRFRIDKFDLAIKQPKGRGMAWKMRAATLKHEFRAYNKLNGLQGIPNCHGLFRGHRLALEFVQGQRLRDARLDKDHPYFDALLQLILDMHARGVAHGDLKRKANLLVSNHVQPIILDFGTATLRKAGWHPVNRRLFDFIRQTDLNAWIKLKYGGYEGLSESDLRLFRRTGIERSLAAWRGRR